MKRITISYSGILRYAVESAWLLIMMSLVRAQLGEPLRVAFIATLFLLSIIIYDIMWLCVKTHNQGTCVRKARYGQKYDWLSIWNLAKDDSWNSKGLWNYHDFKKLKSYMNILDTVHPKCQYYVVSITLGDFDIQHSIWFDSLESDEYLSIVSRRE